MKNKLKNSKGNIYLICPFIDIIESIINNRNIYIDIDIKVEIINNLNSIRQIARFLQSKSDINLYGYEFDSSLIVDEIENPRDLNAMLKTMRFLLKNNLLNEEKFDEVIKLYF